MTAAVLEAAVGAAGITTSATAAVVVARARRQARRALPVPESREHANLARLRELYASDRIDTEQLEAATERVLRGLEPFPPVEPVRPRNVLEAHAAGFAAVLRASSPRIDEAARIEADREARRAARERERWRH